MKSEKGITLTSLIIYMLLIIIVIATLSTISKHFYENIKYVSDSGKYISQYNKFNMFFIKDVKNNTKIYSVSNNEIVFADGTIYTYIDGSIYRNKVEICTNIFGCIFTQKEETDSNNFNKQIITVNLAVKGSKIFNAENEYVLRYW